MEKLEVFEVVKPQGIKGELKARILADSIENVIKIKKLYDSAGKEYLVKSIKNAFQGFAFLSVQEIKDRNDAELYRNVIFYANKKDVRKNKDSYFISDLIGLKVKTSDNEELGVLEDVMQGKVDMFKIKLQTGKTAYFPFLKVLNPKVDLEVGEIVVDGEKLEGVIYYEDWYFNVISRYVYAS